MYNHYYFSRTRRLSPVAQKMILLCLIVIAITCLAGASEASKPDPTLATNHLSLEQIKTTVLATSLATPYDAPEVLMSRGGSMARSWKNAPAQGSTNAVAASPVEEAPPVSPPTPPRVINTSSITTKSNLTAEEFNQVIERTLRSKGYDNTKLSGIGPALAHMEQSYNVNGLFCLAVAAYESGWGTSSAAYGRNNPFGLMSNGSIIRYGSMDACINYWGSLMRSGYFNGGRITISSVSSKYCPPNSSNWASNVQCMYNAFAHEAKQITP